MNNITDAWKIIILQRYAGEFRPHPGPGTAIKKSSEDIAFDLQGMGEFSADEVSAFMAVNGYTIDFDDGKPVWLLEETNPRSALSE